MAVYNPVMETQFYGDGEHNQGVFYWGNLNPYIYTYQNPVKYIDPNGKQSIPLPLQGYSITTATAGGSFGGEILAGGFAALPVAGIIILYNNKQLANNFNANKARQESHITLKDEQQALLRENYPVAEKDNLIVRTIPAAGVGKIKILNASKRSNNKLQPESQAYGDHSTFETDDNGDIYKYETYEKTKTGYFNPKKRFDGGKKDGSAGAAHDGVTPPHINFRDKKIPVRKPTSQEYPRNNRFKGKY